MSSKDSDIPTDYKKKVKDWKDKLKEKWDYNRKLIEFEGSDGQIVTFTTTSSTSATTTTPVPNVTSTSSSFSPVVVITTQAGGAKTGEVASANTTQLVTIVGITCGSLLALMIILLIFIRICRGSPRKRKQRISLRRPLHPPEPEEHIYAEIEPLQRTASPGGASGNSGDVQLPSKKHRKRGISSFRALSTRIYRFFGHDQSDNQSVFYNRNNQEIAAPPEPPERNISPRRKRGAGVKRFESTASRRALLDGDSQTSNSSAVEMRPSTSSDERGNIYNPLLRESDSRISGPYDHLTLSKTDSSELPDDSADNPPESPHDYFTLESNANKTSPQLPGRNGKTHLSPVTEDISEDSNPLDTLIIENEKNDADENKDGPRVTSTHDYFVLEPHQKEPNGSPSKSSVKSNVSPIKELENGSVNKSPSHSPDNQMKEKPVAKPRVTKTLSPVKSNPSSPTDKDSVAATADGHDTGNEINDMIDEANYIDPSAKTKDDIYVLSKLGTAPEPPEVEVDQEYLKPLDIMKSNYVDVFPNPPPRTTSLHPEEHGSLIKHDSPVKQNSKESPVKQNSKESPKKQISLGSPTKQNSSESTV